MDSLGLVDLYSGSRRRTLRVIEQVGDDIANQVREFMGMARAMLRANTLTYGAFEKAKHFQGWRSGPLAAECAWMLP